MGNVAPITPSIGIFIKTTATLIGYPATLIGYFATLIGYPATLIGYHSQVSHASVSSSSSGTTISTLPSPFSLSSLKKVGSRENRSRILVFPFT